MELLPDSISLFSNLDELYPLKERLQQNSKKKVRVERTFRNSITFRSLETELHLRGIPGAYIEIAFIQFRRRRIGTGRWVITWLKEYARKQRVKKIKIIGTTTPEIVRFAKKHKFTPIEGSGIIIEGIFYGDWEFILEGM